ncbi:Tetratricopeptide repeat-containing protein [Formivibrio citricus]|uniref:Tetratricopeptide repeat-containing protein n=1 Tax=Formivibrio citricus TaxID=83765 RepID=A0A1I5AHW6_9NEIS|nr:tetratricopeptide repeat protein [Formivibrio citricus]SFN61960.1 Tetratricopeptide repeat-containing protein [Formivibrio citricus]
MISVRQFAVICVVLLSGCAGAQSKVMTSDVAAKGQDPCAQIKPLKLNADGTNFENPQLAIDVLSACNASNTRAPSKARAAIFKLRSTAYAQLGDYGKAISDCEESLRLVPARTAWDVITLASLYRQSGQPERALGALRQMLKDHLGVSGKGTTPGMPSYYHLGMTLVALEQWPEAAEAFSEGLTYQPDYAWAYLYRALSYDHMNDMDRARDDVRKGRSLIDALKDDDRAEGLKSLSKPPFATLMAKYPK